MREESDTACPSCGGVAFIPAPDRNRYLCASCQTAIPPQRHFADLNARIAQPTPLKVGMKAMINGKDYFLVAILHYRQTVKNEETGSDESYFWHEYVLLTTTGEARYLEFEERKWQLSEPIDADPTIDDRFLADVREGQIFNLFGHSVHVSDRGRAMVIATEGALPWELLPGKAIPFVDLDSVSGKQYAATYEPETRTWEWYKRRPVSDRDVLAYFGLSQLIQNDIVKESKAQEQRRFGWATIGIAFLALVAWLVMPNTGSIIARGTTGGTPVPEEGLRFGPFALKETARPSRFRLSASVPNNSSTWAQGVIESPEGKPLFGLDGEFWSESGYDEGYWAESVTAAQQEYHLDRARQVFVRIFTDPDGPNGTGQPPGTPEIPVSFSIEEGVSYPNHLLWFAFPTLALGVVFLGIASRTAQTRAWET